MTQMLGLLKNLVTLVTARNILLLLELLAIPIAIFAIFQSSIAIRLQTDANNEQRIANAWTQVATRAPGNSGKGAAIMTLYKNNEALTGLLIDCETMGGRYVKDPELRCLGSPYLSEIEISGAPTPLDLPENQLLSGEAPLCGSDPGIDPVAIQDSNFSGSIFKKSYLYCTLIRNVDFKNTWFDDAYIWNNWLYNIDISGSYDISLRWNRIEGLVAISAVFVEADFRGTWAAGINFTNAKFNRANFAQFDASDLNVSGADFCYFQNTAFPSTEKNCPVALPDSVLDAMWAWSDMPPKGIGTINEKLSKIRTCPASLRTSTFGKEYEGYGFVYDRGYKPPNGCK